MAVQGIRFLKQLALVGRWQSPCRCVRIAKSVLRVSATLVGSVSSAGSSLSEPEDVPDSPSLLGSAACPSWSIVRAGEAVIVGATDNAVAFGPAMKIALSCGVVASSMVGVEAGELMFGVGMVRADGWAGEGAGEGAVEGVEGWMR